MSFRTFTSSLLLGGALALHVVTIFDSVILLKEDFLELSNFNEANLVDQENDAYTQDIDIRITNNFENFKFDLFIFEVNEETGESKDFECYKQAIYSRNWNPDCKFDEAGTKILTNLEDVSTKAKSESDNNDKDRIYIIDNSPLPKGGAQAQDNIVLEYTSSSNYEMTYNLRNVSIYMGIATVFLLFAIGSINYLSFKISKDIKRKFEQGEDEESEEEEEQQDKE